MRGSTKLGRSSGGLGGVAVSSLTMSAILGTPKSTQILNFERNATSFTSVYVGWKTRNQTLSLAHLGCRMLRGQKETLTQGRSQVNLQSATRLCVTIGRAQHPLPFCL